MRRRLAAIAIVAVLSVGGGLLLGLGDGIAVDGVDARGGPGVGTVSGDCESLAMQQASVTVRLSRDDYDRGILFDGPETVTVVATAADETHERSVSLDEVDRERTTLPVFQAFGSETLSARTLNVTIDVRHDGGVIHETTREVALPRVEPGHMC